MGINTIERAKIKAFITGFLSDPAHDNQSSRSMTADVFRIALASLEAEPVAYVGPFAFNNFSVYRTGDTDNKRMGREWMWANPDAGLIPVYTAPPAPVSVPDAATAIRACMEEFPESVHDIVEECAAIAENACRAAMLQGAEPVSDSDELPRDYLHGQKDGLEWAAQLAEANHPHTGDWLYDDPIELAKAIRKGPDMTDADGNFLVVPDGWVPCSDRLPDNNPGSYEYIVFETLNNRAHHDYWNVPDVGDDAFTPFWNHYGEYVTHWMPLPAAPQQEVKS